MYIYICNYVYTYTYVYIYTCIYIYIMYTYTYIIHVRIRMHILLWMTFIAITATTNFYVTMSENGMATAHSGMALLAYALLEIRVWRQLTTRSLYSVKAMQTGSEKSHLSELSSIQRPSNHVCLPERCLYYSVSVTPKWKKDEKGKSLPKQWQMPTYLFGACLIPR